MKKSLLIFFAIIFSFALCACGDSGNGDGDGDGIVTDVSSEDVSFIMESLGINADDAARMCVLLRSSGLDSEIKHVSRENDTETGESYYRVRTDGAKYDVYYYSDGSVKIKVGDEVYSYAGNVGFVTLDADDTATETSDAAEDSKTDASAEETTDTADTSDADVTVDTGEMIMMVVNVSSKKFHYPDCRGVATMSEKNKETVYVNDIDELYDMGYEPCGICGGES